jgi:hypothetical protein
MFEKATRLKLRFNHRGLCSVEDLWDLPLDSLDSIFKSLNAAAKEQNEESLLGTKSKDDEVLDLSLAIVRHIAEVKLRERAEREDMVAKAQKKQMLLGLIEEKQSEELRSMSLEELKDLVEGM